MAVLFFNVSPPSTPLGFP